MRRWRSESVYPQDWDDVAAKLKQEANWTCERCKHRHDPQSGYCLTVHHLDCNKQNLARWNLAVLCQRCHLYMQPVDMDQMLFDFVQVSEWFRPHLEGYNAVRVNKRVNN